MEPDKDEIEINPPSVSAHQSSQTSVTPIATSSSHGLRNTDGQSSMRTVIQQTPQFHDPVHRVVSSGVIKQSTKPATVTTAVLVINTLLPDNFASKEIKKEFNP
ncbi:hypothetical protein DMENIID0001_131240 [Sergentomyia squamirostris]